MPSLVLQPAVIRIRSPTPRANCAGRYASNRLASSVGGLTPFAYDQARSFFVPRCILMKLEQVAGLVLGCIRFLGIREVGRSPHLDDTFIAKFAFCLQASTNCLRDAFCFGMRRRNDEG